MPDENLLQNGEDEDIEAPESANEVEENSDTVGEEYYSVEYSISSYGADYPVDGLVKRINAGSIYIPKFQRGYVWKVFRASRFIESLLLGLPVPSVFLYKEPDSNKHLVIDGQQRLRTLQYFYKETFEPTDMKFRLKGVNARFENKSYSELQQEDRLRLDDSIIHAIIVKQDNPNEGHEAGVGPSSVYHIFERLNTGGVLLQPQEIRSCIYHGPFINLLEDLNKNTDWRQLFGLVSTRMRDRELILRFLALLHEGLSYKKPMKEFLNAFCGTHRKLNQRTIVSFTKHFSDSVKLIREVIGRRAFVTSRAVNAALFDAIMVGVARRLGAGAVADPAALGARYTALVNDTTFRQTVSSNTTDDASVENRLKLATKAFADAP